MTNADLYKLPKRSRRANPYTDRTKLYRVVVFQGEVSAPMLKPNAYALAATWRRGKYKGCKITVEPI